MSNFKANFSITRISKTEDAVKLLEGILYMPYAIGTPVYLVSD